MNISVVMATYNGEKHLLEQLDSISNQTRPPDELVVQDDSSTDATAHIVREFARDAGFPVNLSANPRNLGSTVTFEKAIRRASGDLIFLSDQDDVWVPSKLELLEKGFTELPSVGLIFSDAMLVDEDLRPLGLTLWETLGIEGTHLAAFRQGRAFEALRPHNLVTGATLGFRSIYRDVILPIPQQFSTLIHDGWIALLIAAVSDVAYIEEALILYRQHPSQQLGAVINREEAPSTLDKSEARVRVLSRLIRLAYTSMRDRHGYQEDIDFLSTVLERVRMAPSAAAARKNADAISDELRHHWRRTNMPKRPTERLRVVSEELRRGAYDRYSQGLKSAIRDLMRPFQA